jgi:hypothetical protein
MDGKGIILFSGYNGPYDVEANVRRACRKMGTSDK